ASVLKSMSWAADIRETSLSGYELSHNRRDMFRSIGRAARHPDLVPAKIGRAGKSRPNHFFHDNPRGNGVRRSSRRRELLQTPPFAVEARRLPSKFFQTRAGP